MLVLQTNLFILNGSGTTEHYRPEFMYAGFRFVQLWGLPAGVVPTTETLLQHFVHSDVPPVGAVSRRTTFRDVSSASQPFRLLTDVKQTRKQQSSVVNVRGPRYTFQP